MPAYPVLIAVTGVWEAPLVAAVGAARGEVTVVRRCADLTDLLAAAVTGRARAALVSAYLRHLDAEAVARLRQAGVAVVGVLDPGALGQRDRLVGLGVDHVLLADADPDEVHRVVAAAVDGTSVPPAASEGTGLLGGQPAVGNVGAHDKAADGRDDGLADGRDDGLGRGLGEGRGSASPVVGEGSGEESTAGSGGRVGTPRTADGTGSVAAPADPALSVESARWAPSGLVATQAEDARPPGAASGAAATPSGPGPGRRNGRLVAVWGPVGSPGRTTVAMTVAYELAALRSSVVLADADTYGASIGQSLGVLDEAPGLAAACRAASAGTLDAGMLARLAPVVSRDVRVLTGITRADRWPEMSVPALERVWSVVRTVADWTVVDTGFSLERDEELSYDTSAPRRNGATLSALEAADVVVAVGSADPVGLQRLVRGLGELAEVLPSVTPRVVVTRSRASAVGSGPDRRVREALQRYAGVESVLVVPDDRPALDAAMLAGRSLTEHQPHSPARQAMAELASELSGHGAKHRARRTSSTKTGTKGSARAAG